MTSDSLPFALQSLTSTFQGILTADGVASYAVFIYECGGMEWGGATIGWSHNSFLYQEHPLSGMTNSADIGCLYSFAYSAIAYTESMAVSKLGTIGTASTYTLPTFGGVNLWYLQPIKCKGSWSGQVRRVHGGCTWAARAAVYISCMQCMRS